MLTAQSFFDIVVIPNQATLIGNPGDLRHAVNVIASLDDFVGILAHELLKAGKITLKEEKFRDFLASQSSPYRLLRDMAYSLKHGELTGSKSPLVSKPGNLAKEEAAFDAIAFGRSFQTENVIFIEVNDGGGKFAVSDMFEHAILAITDLTNDLA